MAEESSRDKRQRLCVERWKAAKGKATVVGATGFGFELRSRSVEEFTELLSGNIGEASEMGNTEINSEIKKSESSYSVEIENYG